MALLRFIIGRIILLINFIFSPKAVKRDPQLQQKLDEKTANFSIYQLNACPFCVKVRRSAKRQNLNIEYRDIKKDNHLADLLQHGGKRTVPCLRIDNNDGTSKWMYESKDIVAYLDEIAQAA
ncbi:glutaredoxin family protein [Thalassomonas sp. M1454]|uniref:glutaredoxin family protein n=1 Tax=Thalassomonas sp. M1454 TaxID=2594477 RepID=UPI00117CE5EC|nr:glutaredoxin [Thalassomonas sp. M1454]TRX57453.1 glutaredoxin [Thalassomonas sp. M1454]